MTSTTTRKRLTALSVAVPLLAGLAGALAGPAQAAPAQPPLVQAYATAPSFVTEDDGKGGMLLLVSARGTGTSWTSGDPSVRKVTVILQQQDDTMPGGFRGIGSAQAVRWQHPVVKLSKETAQHLASCLAPVRTATLVTDRTGRTHYAYSAWASGLSQPACAVFGGAADTGNGNSWTGTNGHAWG